MGTFEKYLTFWVILCILVGIVLGHFVGEQIHILSNWNISTVNVPVAILIWFMIYPMMVQIDFSSIRHVSNNWRGLGLTVVVNWLLKPFTMAFFCLPLFLYHLRSLDKR
jgi:ACR3 family arsenite transporter